MSTSDRTYPLGITHLHSSTRLVQPFLSRKLFGTDILGTTSGSVSSFQGLRAEACVLPELTGALSCVRPARELAASRSAALRRNGHMRGPEKLGGRGGRANVSSRWDLQGRNSPGFLATLSQAGHPVTATPSRLLLLPGRHAVCFSSLVPKGTCSCPSPLGKGFIFF